MIKDAGPQKDRGVVVKPATPGGDLEDCAGSADYVLLMSVNPDGAARS